MKVAWSIDPFEKNDQVIVNADTLVRSLHADHIEVIYVAAPSETALSLAFEIPEDHRFSGYPMMLIQEKLKRLKIRYSVITILKVNSTSKSDQVEEYSNYLQDNKFDFVVLATHAREGIERFFQGSFSEAMILNAKTNLIIFNPKDKVSSKIKKVLFAHDLSKTATRNLQKIDKFAKQISATVEVDYVSEPNLNYNETSPILFAENYRKLHDQKIDFLKSEINAVNPDIKVFIENYDDSVSDLIIKRSKKNSSDMIVVSSKVGSFVAAMGGSISRQVVRRAQHPVMVMVGI
jgi:nucleotide-binding universal stress UspA family protein